MIISQALQKNLQVPGFGLVEFHTPDLWHIRYIFWCLQIYKLAHIWTFSWDRAHIWTFSWDRKRVSSYECVESANTRKNNSCFIIKRRVLINGIFFCLGKAISWTELRAIRLTLFIRNESKTVSITLQETLVKNEFKFFVRKHWSLLQSQYQSLLSEWSQTLWTMTFLLESWVNRFDLKTSLS